jgi:hypothetical protein
MTRLEIISNLKNISPLIQNAIFAEIKRLELGVLRTNKKIQELEERNQISSEQFLANYTAENLRGGDEEYITWLGELKMQQRLTEKLKQLQEIDYVIK